MKFNLKYKYSFLLTMMSFFLMISCQDMLDADSNRLVFEDENAINDPNSPFYAISGILSEVQKIGDNYVLMGELRGDLMTVSQDASVWLKEINEFQVSSENVYINKRDYYSVINNCNYAIQKMDTTIFVHGENVMIPALATIKSIRAWTYLQMVQIFGSAVYLEKPILDLESSLSTYPVVDADELVDLLIKDLIPYMHVSLPSNNSSPNFFAPVSIMLGDLYLYQNKYEQAATTYHYFMDRYGLIISENFASRWTKASADEVEVNHVTSYSNESISTIWYSTEPQDLHSDLVNLTLNDKASLLPVSDFVKSMSEAPHFYANKMGENIAATLDGDLRGNIRMPKANFQVGDAYYFINTGMGKDDIPLIYKYFNIADETSSGAHPDNNLITGGLSYLTRIPIYRIPHLYLRYAEAVNRAGKPTLAFAVLKYGLTNANIKNAQMVNPSEVENNEPYINFQNSIFDSNIGTASRGRGFGIPKDQTVFVIPDYTRYVNDVDGHGNPIRVPSKNAVDREAALQDSIHWVELRILDEMAAETPFEGNRFFDLLRISKHRDNHPEFMAQKVSSKYQNPTAMKNKLMNMNAWFIK